MTHINGVGNTNNLTPMQRLMQQASVTRAANVPIVQNSNTGDAGFYPGLNLSTGGRLAAFLDPTINPRMAILEDVCSIK